MKRSGPPKRKKPLRKKGKKASTVKTLDALLRQIVLQRDGGCQMAGDPDWGPCGGALCVSHVLPKKKYPAMRYLLENVKILCWVHHDIHSPRSWHSSPVEAGRWFQGRFPDRWLRLAILKQEPGKVDRKADAEYLERQQGLMTQEVA